MVRADEAVTSKEALGMIKPFLEGLKDARNPVHFCTDEVTQRRRQLAEMIATEGLGDAKGEVKGKEKEGKRGEYDVEWCVAALEAEGGDLDRARGWLRNWAPMRGEGGR